VPTPPESFLQLAQWQNRISSGTSGISNLTPPQRQVPRRALTSPSLYVVALFAAAAVYELALAVEWIALPKEPGADPRGAAIVFVATLVAIVGTYAVGMLRIRDLFFVSIPLTAAVWMVAHYYAFDPYYAPSSRRYSDAGSVSPWWVYGVALVGLGVAAASRRTSVLAPLYVTVCLLTVIGMGLGH
jgi:hypothetical protein